MKRLILTGLQLEKDPSCRPKLVEGVNNTKYQNWIVFKTTSGSITIFKHIKVIFLNRSSCQELFQKNSLKLKIVFFSSSIKGKMITQYKKELSYVLFYSARVYSASSKLILMRNYAYFW